MGAECCKKSCNKSCKLFLQLLSNELWVHAHYGATKVLCTALLECGGVVYFYFCNDEEQARAFTLHREKPGQSVRERV